MPSQKQWDFYYMTTCFGLAEFSKARRLKVGGYLTKDNRPLINGYNGTPEGFSNDCEIVDIMGAWEDKVSGFVDLETFDKIADKNLDVKYRLITKSEVSHAESNIIGRCCKWGIPTEGTILYLTDSPCMSCCVLLNNSGIKRIVYVREYRDPQAIEFCKQANIQLEQLKDFPYEQVINFFAAFPSYLPVQS